MKNKRNILDSLLSSRLTKRGEFSKEFQNILSLNQPKYSCAQCHTKNCELRCSQCKETYYCNRDCQIKNWKLHRKECKLTKKYNNKLEKEEKKYSNDLIMQKTIKTYNYLYANAGEFIPMGHHSIKLDYLKSGIKNIDKLFLNNKQSKQLQFVKSIPNQTPIYVRMFIFDHLHSKVYFFFPISLHKCTNTFTICI